MDQQKCKECGHNGNGLHLCRGGSLFKKLLELKENDPNGILFCNSRKEESNRNPSD